MQIPEGGGGSPRRRGIGPRGREGLCGELGGGLKYFFRGRNSHQGCDPDCLLQGPETSKVPKVVRRGCKRSSGPRAPKSSCTGAKESCTGAKQGLGGAKDSWETFALWAQNTFCTLSQPLWALLRFRAPVAGTRGRNTKDTSTTATQRARRENLQRQTLAPSPPLR